MSRHPLDPASAVLGAAALGCGIAVASDSTDGLATNPSLVFALLALVFGAVLIPWGRPARGAPTPSSIGSMPSTADVEASTPDHGTTVVEDGSGTA